MAGSRLHKIGTIFTRVTGLLRSGAMKETDKPLWYDVYQAFPPKYEPCFTRPVPKNEITAIFYKEDVIRAKFYKEFGSPGIIDMSNEKSSSLSQRFINKYMEMEENNKEGDLFEETAKALEMEGVTLVRKLNQKEEEETYTELYDTPLVLPVEERAKT